MKNYFLAFVLAFVFSAALTPVVRLAAKLWGIVDEPKGLRKLHETKTPLLGGVAVFFAFAFTVFIFLRFGLLDDGVSRNFTIFSLLIGSLVIAIGGFLDDKYGLSPGRQIVFPLLAALIVLFAGVRIEFITNPLGGVIEIPAMFGILLTFFWIMGMMYTTKFLDGMDGLVSGIAFIAAITIFIVSLFWDVEKSSTSFLALMVAGSAFGFLLYNFHPAKIFLGEGGSVFFGFILAVLSIISGSKIATAFLVMSLPILDTFFVIARRIRQGKSPVQGDRKHFHFRLLDRGWGVKKSVFFIYFITIVLGLSALVLNTGGKIIAIAIDIVILAFLVHIFYSRRTFWSK